MPKANPLVKTPQGQSGLDSLLASLQDNLLLIALLAVILIMVIAVLVLAIKLLQTRADSTSDRTAKEPKPKKEKQKKPEKQKKSRKKQPEDVLPTPPRAPSEPPVSQVRPPVPEVELPTLTEPDPQPVPDLLSDYTQESSIQEENTKPASPDLSVSEEPNKGDTPSPSDSAPATAPAAQTEKSEGEGTQAPSPQTEAPKNSGGLSGLLNRKNSAADSSTFLSNQDLLDKTDALVSIKGIQEKSKKEKRQEKKAAKPQKATSRNIKRKSARLKIPKTVQESIPYECVYEHEGIIEIEPGIFTKSYLLQDVNYQIAKQAEQNEMYTKYAEFLNSFDPSLRFQISINQRNINMDAFEEETMLLMKDDGLDHLRKDRNMMMKAKISEGRNNLIKEKYLTVSCSADSLEDARTLFARLDSEIAANLKKIGDSTTRTLSIVERLEILHDLYNHGSEGSFGNNMELNENGEPVFCTEKFRFDIMRRQGLTTKDMIGPESMTFRTDYGMLGDTYFRALFLRKIPTFVNDQILSELTKTECNMITSLFFEPIDGERALKMARTQITNVNANMVEKQKQASKAGYSTELISPELKDAAQEAGNLFEDLTSKNQKLFYMTTVIVHFADDLEQLNSDTKSIFAIGNRLMCDIKKLSWQQENGLNTALPLCNNQLHIKRSLTTECAAIFMPFDTQELNDKGGSYYGINAVSHNLIRLDRRQKKNGNGFIFGTPGAGKSMSAKQEMLTTLLSSDDDVIVIDPEGEYYPMAELLGGEVIRIATGGDQHINPFDIDMTADSEDDPITIKSDFIVSLCETILGDRYGLNPTQISIIDRCVHKVYEPYLNSYQNGAYDNDMLPTLKEFYDELCAQPGYDAKGLADGLEIYVHGSLNVFAEKTNVEYSKRFVVYDIKDIGSSMKSMGLLVVLDNIWNRIVQGRKKGKYTWFFIDEIYLLFKKENSAEFLRNLYKRARKYYGIPTGITQNVSDLLENPTARTMISNCEYIQMLNQAPLDRAQLAELLNISDTQLSFITNASPGEGLIYDGTVIVPFQNQLPKDTAEYEAMTTKPSEVKEREQRKQQALLKQKQGEGSSSEENRSA